MVEQVLRVAAALAKNDMRLFQRQGTAAVVGTPAVVAVQEEAVVARIYQGT